MTENRIDSKGSAFFFEGAAVPTVKSDSLVLEPIVKSDSNLPKRKTRHNRSVTPMGNITDMLRSAKETQNLDSNLFRYT